MPEWKFTDIFKPLITLFQPTTSYNKSDKKPDNDNTFCKAGGIGMLPINLAVEWFIGEADYIKGTKKKSSNALVEETRRKFISVMHDEVNEAVNYDENFLRIMENARISHDVPLKNTVGIINEQVYIHEDNRNIDNLVARLDSNVQRIIKKHFGEKYAEDLKGLSIGRKVLERVRSRCIEEANNTEHNVPNADEVHDIAVPNVPSLAKSNNAIK